MDFGGPMFVLAIIAMSTVGWIVTTAIRARHGYPVTDEFQWNALRRSNFEFGYITWSSNTGVQVHGCAGFQGDAQLKPVPN